MTLSWDFILPGLLAAMKKRCAFGVMQASDLGHVTFTVGC
jgi:hypothetical protein